MSTTPGSTLAATALVFRLELVLPLFWLLDGFGTWPEEVPVEFPSLLLFSATAEPAPAAAASTATPPRPACQRRRRRGGSPYPPDGVPQPPYPPWPRGGAP